jgi:hypothetical protein
MNLGKVLNSYLPTIFNCLEDARVNARTFDARPGMRIVFDLNIEKLMTEGTEIGVGKFAHWSEAPLDSQFMVGLSLLAAGHTTEDRFHVSVVEALADQQLIDLCTQATDARHAHDIFELSVEVFRRAQNLGFCVVPKCEVAPPAPPSPQESGSPGSDDCSVDQGSDDSVDSDSSDPEDKSADASDTDKSDNTDKSDEGGEFGEHQDGTATPPESSEPEDTNTDGSDSSSDTDGSDDVGDGTSADSAERETSKGSGTGSPGQSSEKPNDEADETESSDSNGSNSKDSDDSDERAEPLDEDESSVVNDSGSGSKDTPVDSDEDSDEGDSDDDQDLPRRPETVSADGNDDRDLDQLDEDDSDDGTSAGNDSPQSDTEGEDGDLLGNDNVPEGSDESVDDEVDSDFAPERTDTLAEDPWETVGPDDTGAPFDMPNDDGDASDGPTLEHGTPEDIARTIGRFLMHGTDGTDGLLDTLADGDLEKILGIPEDETGELSEVIKQLIDVALRQVVFFDDSSLHVAGVEEVTYPHQDMRWEDYYSPDDFRADESMLGAAVLKARRVFDDNQRAKHLTNLKSGRINTRVLGRRAPLGDPRLFGKKVIPGKRSYFVVVGFDCSGSTGLHERNAKIKRAGMAQLDLLTRLGVPFAAYAHTAYTQPLSRWHYSSPGDEYYVYILPIKKENEPWNDLAKRKLANVMPVADNLDGHTLEYYRKVAEHSTATDKIIIYFTDGEMPAANWTEEREILEREVKHCEKRNITLLGVGINTDSPKQYGMDTVRIDSDADIHLVVEQLDRRLVAKG